VIERLASNLQVFGGLVVGVSGEQARWKPEPERWSLVEVMSHLVDEERDDFRTRLELTLRAPAEPWPPINPEQRAVDDGYLDRDLSAMYDSFVAERNESLEWLRSLGNVDLTLQHQHPTVGPMLAGDLLCAWLAHDLIHIRQMTRLHYQYHLAMSEPYTVAYAGRW
jgi:hypothetical protein